MKKDRSENFERLIRVMTVRRGASIELRVHYERKMADGCQTYRLLSVEDVAQGTSTS